MPAGGGKGPRRVRPDDEKKEEKGLLKKEKNHQHGKEAGGGGKAHLVDAFKSLFLGGEGGEKNSEKGGI